MTSDPDKADPAQADSGQRIAALDHVTFRWSGTTILDDVTWHIGPGEQWALLGPNGSGKTTIARIMALYEHPSSGSVEVLGETLGRVDVRSHRQRIGLVSPALADQLRPTITAEDVVVTAMHAALEPWWHTYSPAERSEAREHLESVGAGPLADRAFAHLSSGERQRVMIARQLMAEAELIILDEPTAGLDLAARESLIADIGALGRPDRAVVSVTHHPEEIPASFDHALLLRQGRVLASGPIDEVLSAELLSECFGIALTVDRVDGRWWARARTM